ncbi:MAG: site-specific integrase [Actinobacteria bacterium]|nr:site-specific integrase [Actinomycetota bacterium]
MTAPLIALPEPSDGSLLAKLVTVVRPEFQVELIPIDPDDPVFGRGRCQVGGCERGSWARGLCGGHHQRWLQQGGPDVAEFVATAAAITPRVTSYLADTFDLRALHDRRQMQLEVAYSIQCRHDDRGSRLMPEMIRQFVKLLANSSADSLLDHAVGDWLGNAIGSGLARRGSRTVGQLRYAHRRLVDLYEGTDADSEFARDVWRAEILGLPISRPPRSMQFHSITHLWLRTAAKRWARFRLSTGKAFGTVYIEVRSLHFFSRFLAEQHPEVTDETALTREVIEHYISWLGFSHLSANPINTYLVCLRGFLESCRRHGWLPGLNTHAAVYLDELPPRPRELPRFIDEFVMTQLEDPDNLALLPDDTTRNLLVVIIETGLRITDACRLPFNPIIDDSVGWPCLRYMNTKMRAEQLVPLSAAAAEAIRDQQVHLRERWSEPPPQLFPSPHCNPDGLRAFSDATFRQRLKRWERDIDLRDEADLPVHVTPHRFRHTLGTRMINQGVPQHVVQKLLGHATPQMTARYAHIHDTTVRAAFDDYQRRRVDIHGQRLDFDPDAPAAEAEWIKHNVARVQASLPNGYCGRPPQQDCPHPNACLTCPDFQTTPQFLEIHRRQRDETIDLLAAVEHAGNARLVDNHRKVATNLDRIVTALETIQAQGDRP